MASYVPGELIPCALVWHDPGITPCCKSIFGISSRNIDSRSDTNEQQGFKRTDAPIRLLQISISQSLLGDFCNTICQYSGQRF
jgi:hypothetical protein